MRTHQKKYYGGKSKEEYRKELKALQIELVKLQRHFIEDNEKILVIFEGRDAAGKDGTIKRITQHLSPRETRVVALGKPSDRDRASWYFQRYVEHLPAEQEMVLMNRSWYNRAGVEPVMGFCTTVEKEAFMQTVPQFEAMLIDSGVRVIKYYLDISKEEQAQRLADRRRDPLKQWKISPIDEVSLEHWDDYSVARDEMFLRTSSEHSPWFVVQANNKRRARLNVIRHLLAQIDYPGASDEIRAPKAGIVAKFDPHLIESGRVAG